MANRTNKYLDGAGLTYLIQKIKTVLNSKQDALTFDSTPTANSTNPVTSGGIKTALDEKQDKVIELSRYNIIRKFLAGEYNTATEENPATLTADEIAQLNEIGSAFNKGALFTIMGVLMSLGDGWWSNSEGTLYFSVVRAGSAEISFDFVINGSNGGYWTSLTQTEWQKKLTFDDTPTSDSSNPVKSGGVYTAIQDATEFYKIPSADVTAIFAASMYHVVQDQTILNTACEAILTALKNDKRITWDFIDGYDVTNFVIVRGGYADPSDDDKTVQLLWCGSTNLVEIILTKDYTTSNWSASMGGQSLVPSVQGDGNAITSVNTTDGQFILNKDKTFLESESDPIFTASAAYNITSNNISTWNGKQDALVSGTSIKTINNTSLLGSGDLSLLPSNTHIPADLKVGSVAGKMYRNNVGGTGNFSISGNSGCIPNLVAGTFLVAIYAKSATQSYTFRFNFGSTIYDLSTTNGEINDLRTITISSAATFSGSVVTSSGVASGTILYVTMYNYLTPIQTVGPAAVTNRYSDLDGTPTIPTVNNGTLTIQKEGTAVATFTANQSGNSTANIVETDPTVPSWAKASSKPTYTASEVGALPSTTQIPTNTSDLVNDSGFVDKQIYLGTSPASDAASYNKTATVETFPTEVVTIEGSNVTQPKVGIIIGVKYLATNTYKTSGSTYTLNVNNLGAYPMYYNNAALATSTSPNTLVAGYLNRYIYYIFNGTQWVWLTASYDSNTTYSNVSLGQGYTGNCTTAAATVAKTAALSSYSLTTGGIVVVTFTNGNTAKSPTLNINSKGAKAIYFRGAACPTDLIQAGDRVTMIYSSQYHIVSIARRNGNILTADASANTIALKDNNTTLSTIDIKSVNGVSLLGQGDLTVVGSNQPISVVTVNGGVVTQAMDANVLYIIGSSATPCTSLTFTLNAGGSNTTNYYHAIVTCAADMTFTKPSSVTLVDGRKIPSFTAGSVFEFSILENQLAYFYTEA